MERKPTEAVLNSLYEVRSQLHRLLYEAFDPGDSERVITEEFLHAKVGSLIQEVRELEARRERRQRSGQQGPSAMTLLTSPLDRQVAVETPTLREKEEGGHVALQETVTESPPPEVEVVEEAPSPVGEYPRFLKEKDRLVKIGWSRSKRDEYEHDVPFHVIALVSKKYREAGSGAKFIKVKDLLPLEDAEGGSIPSYQVYDCVAWLRSSGLLEKQGHQGYRANATESFFEEVNALLQQTPERACPRPDSDHSASQA